MKDELQALLAELEAAIERTRETGVEDPHLAELVEKVNERMQAEDDEHEGFVDHLETSAVRFEVDHPKLAAAIRRASDVLSGYGI